MFSKSADRKSVCPYGTWKLAKQYKKELYQIVTNLNITCVLERLGEVDICFYNEL